ncbi:type I restriction enzyme R subunit [Propionibacteriaceae bacterium ES.041]|uniref:Restriction endonuclease subunit R n=1 Tax=Enemella evansiae TaxID=2016499 RepID=A0A255GM00_9ACTN|nr:DEAD/DEAH box helicase family protein [Enemella evansiae]OYO16422.1 restriction endonuclease subunit R [Enemella evansiae]PFG65255.1 type I restriction enzyme R subunit [Propionibacteriaceae bacterium ES.041]TDO91840.1 type I restriction enzyme R subunit [Enemella evansiae]
MSNFPFLKASWPEIHADCVRAESYLVSDPRAACIYSRRAIEVLVGHLYDLLAIRTPYKDDLSARINNAAFKTETGNAINMKLNLLRKLGNVAVHQTQPVQKSTSVQALRDLHHVMIWAALRYSITPDAVPTQSVFDEKLAARAAPLSRAEVVRLAQKFKERDEAYAKELAEKDELLAQHEREIAELREQVQAAQAASTIRDNRDYNEAETRDEFIDILLHEAGWPLDQPRDREYEVDGMPNNRGTGYVDYVLWGADGLPLAVVEAKRTSRSAHDGQQQAKLYADSLEVRFGRRPVIFYTNGYEHWIWDDAAGYPPRDVQGFYTRDELELMIQRRTTRAQLETTPIDPAIVERYYQLRAIKAVDNTFDEKQRDALLVMATGSGKTRTVIALVDQLMKANWVKRVLFLADRTALVNQAANAFKAHLPNATTINLVTEKSTDGRVFVSTYPTMLNLVNEVAEGRRSFGPGFFDLIVIDEAHRSVYAKYGAIFDYFDAMLVGLTATPKDEVDHNTYRLFHLEDGVPTDAYGLDEAVDDGYLVPPKGIAIEGKFLRRGIRYADLSDQEKDDWDALDWGDDGPPAEVDAEDVNRFLFNEDTVDKVLAQLMSNGHKVAGGDRLGKTIIFAKSQTHAEFIQKRFDLAWPEYAGHFARVITHGTPYAQSLIDDFSQPEKAPHIAISVDMLDTGIDVPEVVNLVFFKLVRSKSKFWQMIGRGTRLRPDLFGPGEDKKDFLVFDFCGNLEFFSQDLPAVEGSVQKSLTQRLFEDRLGLIRALDRAGEAPDLRRSAAAQLHEFVAGMTLDNVLVRPHRAAVERFTDAEAWQQLSAEDAEQAQELAGLPSSARDTDEQAKRFDLLVLRRQLSQLENDPVTAERAREQIQLIAESLLGKTAIPSVAEQAPLIEQVAGDEWWVDVTLPMLELIRLRLRGLVRLIERTSRNPVYTDFEDTFLEGVEVSLPGTTTGTNPERFRAKATAFLRANEDHVAIQRLRRGMQLTGTDINSLEAILEDAGAARTDIAWAAEQQGGLGRFLRTLIGLDRTAAQEAFAEFLQTGDYTVDQVRFVTMIINELTANGVMEPRRLFESPYTDDGEVFTENQLISIAEKLRHLNATATPVTTETA